MNFPPVPPEIKSVAHFLKVAEEHQERNVVISFWCCMYAVQHAMKIVPGNRPPQVTQLLVAIMDWLEKTKVEKSDVDGIANETAAHAIIEDYCLKMFDIAESQDQAEIFDKNTIKLFYTSSILMDVLQQFGELSDDMSDKRKYAKWRASYIHGCLKNGEQPISGNAKIMYTKEDEENFKDFMSKEDYEKMKDEQNNGASTSTSVQPTEPIYPSKPSTTGPSFTPDLDFTPTAGFTPSPVPNSASAFVPAPATTTPQVSTSALSVGPEQMEKAQKYCKWASSALNYEDVNTAITNLQKALNLLQFGKEM